MLFGNLGSTLPTGLAVIFAAGLLHTTGANADVRSSTQTRSYWVGGTTAPALVSYMKSRPFHGSNGAAVANIRPSYNLSIATRPKGSACSATVDLRINFVMTLPNAKQASSMSSGTRSHWNTFVSYARRHEETHRSIYMDCGRSFVLKAQRMTAASCGTLQGKIRGLLEAEKRACNRRQIAFDRADYGRIFGLGLFKQASYKSRKPTVASASGLSRSIAAPLR
jgi:predicted secreted Zn-dependent protease